MCKDYKMKMEQAIPKMDGTWGIHFLVLRFPAKVLQSTMTRSFTQKGQQKWRASLRFSNDSTAYLEFIREHAYLYVNPATVLDPDGWKPSSLSDTAYVLETEVWPAVGKYVEPLVPLDRAELSRLDLARDMHLPLGVTPPDADAVRRMDVHYQSGRCTGFESRHRRNGSKDMFYNKSIERSRKQYADKPPADTWRFETQLLRRDDKLPRCTLGSFTEIWLWDLLEERWNDFGFGKKTPVDPVAAALLQNPHAHDNVIRAVLKALERDGMRVSRSVAETRLLLRRKPVKRYEHICLRRGELIITVHFRKSKRLCSRDDCDRVAKSQTLCGKHYRAKRRELNGQKRT
jgi:hypothetical protein